MQVGRAAPPYAYYLTQWAKSFFAIHEPTFGGTNRERSHDFRVYGDEKKKKIHLGKCTEPDRSPPWSVFIIWKTRITRVYELTTMLKCIVACQNFECGNTPEN